MRLHLYVDFDARYSSVTLSANNMMLEVEVVYITNKEMGQIMSPVAYHILTNGTKLSLGIRITFKYQRIK